MLIQYFKTALRSLNKYKTQSAISIVGVAIGFTAFILGGYWYYWESNFDNFHPEADRLYAITTTGIAKNVSGGSDEINQLHRDDEAYFKQSMPEIEQVCSFTWHEVNPEINGNIHRIHGIIADSSFFNMFYSVCIDGGYKGEAFDKKSVILSEKTALKLFGTTKCTGKSFLSGTDYLVAGVMKNYPQNTEFILDYILLGESTPNNVHRYITYIRTKKNVDIKALRTKIEAHKSIAKTEWWQDSSEKWKFKLRTPAEVHLTCHPELNNRFRNIRILAIAGLLAFLSSLMNLLVLFIGQQKERKNGFYISLGASKYSLVIKSYTELLTPLLAGFLLSICLIELIFPYYQDYTAWQQYGMYANVSNRIQQSGLLSRTLLYMGVSCFLFILASLIPILSLVRSTFGQFKAKRVKVSTPVQLRRILIIGQVCIGSLFFISSLVLFKQLYFIQYADKGIDYRHVIQVDLGFETCGEHDIRIIKNEILENPYVEKVSFTYFPVFNERIDWFSENQTGLAFSPEEIGNKRDNYCLYVDQEYFSLFGIQLKAGTWIGEQNPYDLLVNETGFRQLGYKDLLSRKICFPEGVEIPDMKVCGVVNDFHYNSMQLPVSKIFYIVYGSKNAGVQPPHFIYVRYKPGHKEEVITHLGKVTQGLDKKEVSEDKKFVELATIVDGFNKQEETIFTLFSILAFICILISTFGIFSLVSLSTEQRKKEIAIRKVNGATFGDILQLFFREYLLLVVIGNAIALTLGYAMMNRWLETYAYHIPLSWWLFALVFLITCVIVILSIFRQVNRAARTNPADAVKAE